MKSQDLKTVMKQNAEEAAEILTGGEYSEAQREDELLQIREDHIQETGRRDPDNKVPAVDRGHQHGTMFLLIRKQWNHAKQEKNFLRMLRNLLHKLKEKGKKDALDKFMLIAKDIRQSVSGI